MTPTPEIQREFYGLMDAMREGNLSEAQKIRLDQLLNQYESLLDDYIDYTLLWHALRCYQPLSQEEQSCVTAGMADREAIEHEARRRLDRFLAEQEEIRRLQRPDPRTQPFTGSGRGRPADRSVAHLPVPSGGWRGHSDGRDIDGPAGRPLRPAESGGRPPGGLDGCQVGHRLRIPKGGGPAQGFIQAGTGLCPLVFQKGAGAWIEAPAEFRLRSANEMTLQSGRLFSEVPPSAKGFTVDTPYSRVVDLGTQFGIRVEPGRASDIHLVKGKAALSSNTAGQAGRVQTLTTGQARSVDTNGQVHDIQVDKAAFVRRFFRKSGFTWRGQPIDLADVVGGGNGFGTGRLNRWLEISTGRDGTRYILNGQTTQQYQTTDNRYHRVAHLPYVDGVFSPDGAQGPSR